MRTAPTPRNRRLDREARELHDGHRPAVGRSGTDADHFRHGVAADIGVVEHEVFSADRWHGLDAPKSAVIDDARPSGSQACPCARDQRDPGRPADRAPAYRRYRPLGVEAFQSAGPGSVLDAARGASTSAAELRRRSHPRRPIESLDPKGVYTVDTPVPIGLVDLNLADRRAHGKLENRSSRIIYHKLISRIETVRTIRATLHVRQRQCRRDTMAEVISHLFRLPANGRPMTIMQLAGSRSSRRFRGVGAVRMAFDFGLWSDGVSPLLFVCEERTATRSADRNVGFGRRASDLTDRQGRPQIRRLSRARHPGPAELDATIISNANTLFSMRLANDRTGAVALGGVGCRRQSALLRALARHPRGAGVRRRPVALPTRLRFKEVPPIKRPRSEATTATVPSVAAGHDTHFRGARFSSAGAAPPRSATCRATRVVSMSGRRHERLPWNRRCCAVAGLRSRPLLGSEEAAAAKSAGGFPAIDHHRGKRHGPWEPCLTLAYLG